MLRLKNVIDRQKVEIRGMRRQLAQKNVDLDAVSTSNVPLSISPSDNEFVNANIVHNRCSAVLIGSFMVQRDNLLYIIILHGYYIFADLVTNLTPSESRGKKIDTRETKKKRESLYSLYICIYGTDLFAELGKLSSSTDNSIPSC